MRGPRLRLNINSGEGKMTTYARRTAQHESGEWVVDTATGRIVRRERPLLGRVRSVPSLSTLDSALAIEHAFADLRVFCLADEPQTLPESSRRIV